MHISIYASKLSLPSPLHLSLKLFCEFLKNEKIITVDNIEGYVHRLCGLENIYTVNRLSSDSIGRYSRYSFNSRFIRLINTIFVVYITCIILSELYGFFSA